MMILLILSDIDCLQRRTMRITEFKTTYATVVLIAVAVLLWVLSHGHMAAADVYTDSAHGDTIEGVNRSTSTCENWPGEECVTGSCAHCHDTFDPSICGDELNHPNMLFSTPLYTQQNTGFCLECHKAPSTPEQVNSVQMNMPKQRSYSYKFGGGPDGCPSNIRQALNFAKENGNSRPDVCSSDNGSAHHLTSIRDFLQGRWEFGDTLTDINPCDGCHNPHRAQQHDYPVGSEGTSPISLPSTHDDDWGIFGAATTERMASYASPDTYLAPYYYGGTNHEPEGDGTDDGSNMPDYVTFCTDCHNSSTTIYSEQLDRNLYQFDWATEKHGRAPASNGSGYTDLRSPYEDTECGTYVLSCTDCHEPHGTPNTHLIRREVNRFQPSIPGGRGEWTNLCEACHDYRGHNYTGPHYKILQQGYCNECHIPGDGNRPCTNCHYHGGSFTTWADTYKTF
jgi:hypothetical protein